MKYNIFTLVLTLIILLPSIKTSAQFSLYDPDVQSMTMKGDSFYVETEVSNQNRHKKIKLKDIRTYTWALGGQIQSSQSGYAGCLLHGDYTSINNDHSLREQGSYWFGLKHKEWRYWYPNGKMKKMLTWNNGVMQGDFADFDEEGNVARYGSHRKGKIEGKVYYYLQNKPVKIEYYHKGVLVKTDDLNKSEKKSQSASEFFKKVTKKKIAIEKKTEPRSKQIR